jgi:hypothetical protein
MQKIDFISNLNMSVRSLLILYQPHPFFTEINSLIETLSQIHVLFETMMLLTMQETKVLRFDHRVDKKQPLVEQDCP